MAEAENRMRQVNPRILEMPWDDLPVDTDEDQLENIVLHSCMRLCFYYQGIYNGGPLRRPDAQADGAGFLDVIENETQNTITLIVRLVASEADSIDRINSFKNALREKLQQNIQFEFFHHRVRSHN